MFGAGRSELSPKQKCCTHSSAPDARRLWQGPPGQTWLVTAAWATLPGDAGGSIQGWPETFPPSTPHTAHGAPRGQWLWPPFPGRQRSAQPPAWYLDTSQAGAARHPRCTADSGSPSPLGGSTSCSVWLRLWAPSQHLALSGNGHRRDIGFGSAPGQKPLLTDESVCAAPGPPAHWSNNNLDADDNDIHHAVPARCQPRL